MEKPTKCYLCETELNKIAVGLNKKLHGRKVEKFFCLRCLAEHLDMTVEDLLAKVEDFKAQGCTLFN
ncbi:hypothetical protein Desdi_0768 [Desulfitobacterium dichloroeliminans LMG P-21439]|uniref:Uncharacterized protein n=1 Tax=Desulfitobacterium dichloroeliminans (strain LMG P-21439 / DCA1) TaxID=871963 RepID=L0F366_DESDL|nr:hypothetical protein [Desulfitobacterium dichloroeliminans]AGA68294.1 hypothetical protein Desdi_0768 [Desulfitobacterium dichloroeliminans LMG P-21439]